MLRITLFQFKGIPFFFKEIKNNKKSIKYFLAYSIYNLILILASFYIISNFYAFLSLNMSIEITYIIQIFSITISYILYRIYLDYNWNKYDYKIQYKRILVLKTMDRLLLLLLLIPLLILIGLFIPLFKYLSLLFNGFAAQQE